MKETGNQEAITIKYKPNIKAPKYMNPKKSGKISNIWK